MVRQLEELASRSPALEALLEDIDQLCQQVGSDYASRVRIVFAHSGSWLAINLLTASLVAWMLWDTVPTYLLMPWLVFFSANACLDLIVVGYFQHSAPIDAQIKPWWYLKLAVITTLSLTWGLGAAFGLEQLPHEQKAIVFTAIAMLQLTALPCLASMFAAFSTAVSCTFLPVILAGAVTGKLPTPTLLILATLYVVLMFVGRYFSIVLSRNSELLSDFMDLSTALGNDNKELRRNIARLHQDAVQHRQLSEKLAVRKERAEVTLKAIGDGVISVDLKGKIDYMNPVAEVLTGWTWKDARGSHLSAVFSIVERITGVAIADPVTKCLKNQRAVVGNDSPTLLRRDGLEYTIEHLSSPIHDSAGELIGAVLIFRDVTEKTGMASRIEWQATHDSLTGLINRAEFDQRLSKLFVSESNPERAHALCYLDLDYFKQINDTYGHPAGDELLKQLCTALRSHVRGADTIARLGGDEFAVLLYSCPIDKARMIAEGLRKTVKDFRLQWQGQSLSVGVSIGLVEITNQWIDLTSVLTAADLACYAAKDAGGNRVHIYDDDDRAIAQRHGKLRWWSRLQHAIEADRFELYVQPVQALHANGEPLNGSSWFDASWCEVSVRYLDEDENLIPASQFMQAAEQYHLVPAIERWAIKTTCDALRLGHPILKTMTTVMLKVSSQSIADERSLGKVLALLEDGVDLRFTCIELEEAAYATNPTLVRQFAAKLKHLGCRLCLSGAGLGAKSLQALDNLDIDYLKIGDQIIQQIAHSTVDFEVMVSLNRVAQTAGIETIAGGVETESAYSTLLNAGVNYAQGRYIGDAKPLHQT